MNKLDHQSCQQKLSVVNTGLENVLDQRPAVGAHASLFMIFKEPFFCSRVISLNQSKSCALCVHLNQGKGLKYH